MRISGIIIMVAWGLFFEGVVVMAQSPGRVVMSLSEALERAQESNWTISKVRADEASVKAQYRQTNSVFLPRIGISQTGITTTDPLSAFGFKLQQESVTTQDFLPEALNDPRRANNFNTSLEVEQPLLNLDGLYGRKAAKARLQGMVYQRDRTKETIRFQVKRAYYAMALTQQSHRAIQQSLDLARSNLEVAQNNVEQGFVKEVDVMAAKVRVLELANALRDADDKVKQSGEFLAYLLGMDTRIEIVVSDSLAFESFPLNDFEASSTGRSDLMSYEMEILARKQLLRSSKMKFLPRLNGFGSYQWNDHRIMGRWDNKRILGMEAKNYTLGVRMSWTLFNGYQNIGSVKQARAELQKAQLDYDEYMARNDMEVASSRRNVKVAFDKIAVSRLARDQAKESLRIRADRYEQGLERTTDLLMAQTTYSNRELAYLKALYDYHVAVFKMELLLEINE